MLKYILKRLLLLIPILLGVILLIMFIMSLTPGDPATLLLGVNATPEAVEALNEELGFNDPLPGAICEIRLERSARRLRYFVADRRAVVNEILKRLPVTIELAICSVILTALIGIPLGVISAIKKYSATDMICTSVAMVFTSMPRFWLGMLLIMYFSVKLGWFPTNGVGTWKHFVRPSLPSLRPPLLKSCVSPCTTMLETIRSDYVPYRALQGRQ